MSTVDELAAELKRLYENPANRGKVVEIHFFGMRHAKALSSMSLPALLEKAGMNDSYKAELRKGINLAPYVETK